jgi:hypothetical protein
VGFLRNLIVQTGPVLVDLPTEWAREPKVRRGAPVRAQANSPDKLAPRSLAKLILLLSQSMVSAVIEPS